jgi:hypothetical protein
MVVQTVLLLAFVRDDDNNKRNHQNTFMSTELSAFSSW